MAKRLLGSSASFLFAGLLFWTFCGSAQITADDSAKERQQRDDELLESFRTGEKIVPSGFHRIHSSPKAGQRATYRDAKGYLQTYHVAFLRGNVCTVERQEFDSDVVIAVEFELEGLLKQTVRRAWVGRVGEKPLKARVALPTGGHGGFSSGPNEKSVAIFEDLELGGRNWSGQVTTMKYWKRGDKKSVPPRTIVKTWTSTEDLFREPIREETEVAGTKETVELSEYSESGSALLNWADVSAHTSEEEREIRRPLVRALNADELKRMLSGRLVSGTPPGLHPQPKVGDWATYAGERWTLAVLTDARAVIEFAPEDSENMVARAIEFRVENGKAGDVVAFYAGFRDAQPQMARYSLFTDQRQLEITKGAELEIKIAGFTWKARNERHVRKPLREIDPSEIFELVVSSDAPFGRPLKSKRYYTTLPEGASSLDLSGFGENGKPAMDWSTWKPAWPWEAPFTAAQVKAFIKVGMNWKYKQEVDKGSEGLDTFEQHWTVTEVKETGYLVDCVITDSKGGKRTVKDSFPWSNYVDQIAGLRQGVTSEASMSVSERKIRVVLFEGSFIDGKYPFLIGLSPDLPGVRIRTDEKPVYPSKVWMTEFNEPEPAKGK